MTYLKANPVNSKDSINKGEVVEIPEVLGKIDVDRPKVSTTSGKLTYVGSGYGLQIFDTSNPSDPKKIGSVDTQFYVRNIDVSDNIACVASGYNGLKIIDVGNPESPEIISELDIPGDSTRCVAISGKYVYTIDKTMGLYVVDISDPKNPEIVGSEKSLEYVFNLTVSGDLAYVADVNLGLVIYDISDPEKPVVISSTKIEYGARGVAISENYAYVSGVGLNVIDISDPTSPKIVSFVETPGCYANTVAFWGDNVYVANGSVGLHKIDISDPTKPTIETTVKVSGHLWHVAITDSLAYVVVDRVGVRPAEVGIHIVDVGSG